jgi:hypothetical protein
MQQEVTLGILKMSETTMTEKAAVSPIPLQFVDSTAEDDSSEKTQKLPLETELPSRIA